MSSSPLADRVPVSRRAAALVFTITAALLVYVYGPLVAADPILARDDRSLLNGVRGLSSPLDWLPAVRALHVLDLQPLRDASLLLDLKLSALLGHGTFHATNLLLWCAIALFAFLLFRRVANERLAFAALPLFALHPLFVGSVGWISARKHLLACLFILAATLALLRAADRDRAGLRDRSVALVALLFSLAMLSQPISLLWPVWALGAAVLFWPQAWKQITARQAWPWLVLMALAAAVNGYYYSTIYSGLGAQKLVEGTLADRVLSLGRYAANFSGLAPLAAQYSPASHWNLVGLFSLPIAAWLLIRKAPRPALLWLSFAALPLLLVTAKMTNIFVSDTYALITGVGGFCAILSVLASCGPRLERLGAIVLLVLAIPATWKASRQAQTWMSDDALWAHAAAVEPSPNSLINYGGQLLAARRFSEARAVAERVFAWDPAQRQLPLLYARATASDESLPLAERISRLERGPLSPWNDYFLGSLHARAGDLYRAAIDYQHALAQPAELKAELSIIAAEALVLCRRTSTDPAGCDAAIDALRLLPDWSEARFQQRLRALAPR
jgi:tetratricopeptide (TPR) repeat protein